jgi:RNase P subunit RPR2
MELKGKVAHTAASPIKTSSSPSLRRLVFIESFIANLATSVHTTTARSIQETMLMTLPRLLMDTFCRLCIVTLAMRSISERQRRQRDQVGGILIIICGPDRPGGQQCRDRKSWSWTQASPLGTCILKPPPSIYDQRMTRSKGSNRARRSRRTSSSTLACGRKSV